MHNHEPDSYSCPFCRILHQAKDSLEDTDIVFQDDTVSALLSLARWEKNPLDVLVIPNRHIENIYDLPLKLAPALQRVTREVAIGLKALTRCEGISTRQHNEPAGDQDVWHFQIHVTPRFAGDRFYENCRIPFPETERLAWAERLRNVLLISKSQVE